MENIKRKIPFSDIRFERRDFLYLAAVVLSSFIYSFGMETFVKSGNLFPGGFSGLSRLLSATADKFFGLSISFSVIYFTLNFLVTVIVYRRIGHKFILYSFLWFTMTSFFTGILHLPTITQDPLLIAVFGGLLNGLAIGIALRSNASSGGTDFIAIYFSSKFNKPTWNYIMVVNAMILIIAGAMFGWETALYSIIFQFVSTQVVNTMHQRYKFTNMHIITNKPEEVCQGIFDTCRHGVTKVKCEGGYSEQVHWLLMTTINTYQLKQVTEVVKAVDPSAFIAINSVDQIIGNYYQKPLE